MLLALAPPLARRRARRPKKKLYCWNEGGRKVCGDALPATAVDSARTEISAKSGLATGQVGRALTPEERAAAAAQAEAEQQQGGRGRGGLARAITPWPSPTPPKPNCGAPSTSASLLLDDTIKASQLGIGGLRQSLMSLLRQAGEAELAGKPVKPAAGRQHPPPACAN